MSSQTALRPMPMSGKSSVSMSTGHRSQLEETPSVSTVPTSERGFSESDNAYQNYDTELLKDKDFMRSVRKHLRTEEQRSWFDFVTDVPRDFAVEYAGQRWTHELMASWMKISQDRIPSLNKAMKRAMKKALAVYLRDNP